MLVTITQQEVATVVGRSLGSATRRIARCDARRLWVAGALSTTLAALGAGASWAQGPAAPAAAGTLVFASDADGDADVYAVSARGGRVFALNRNHDTDTVSSLDGTVAREWRERVFVLRGDGGWRSIGSGELSGVYDRGRRVAVVEKSGTLLIAATSGGPRWRVPLRGDPTIAPDGRHVAFEVSNENSETSRVVIAAVGTGRSRSLASGSSVWASWSPDGSLLLVRTERAEGRFEYRIVDVRSSRPPRLVAVGDLGSEQWSPDGRRLAFVRTVRSGAVVTVVEARSGRRWVSRAGEYPRNVVWSSDGVTFAYSDSRAGSQHVVVANARTRVSRSVARSARISSGPLWSPDGKRIAFVEARAASASAVVAAAGGGSRRVLVRGADVALVDWSPDSRRVLFSVGGGIGVVGVDGRVQGTSRTSFAVPREVVWSPDGNEVAFTAGHGGQSVYVLRGDGRRLTRLTRRGHDRILAWLPTAPPTRARAAPSLPATEQATARTLDTRGPVAAVSAHGRAAGVLVAPHELDCIHPVVWRPGSPVVRVGTPAPCSPDGTPTPFDIELRQGAVLWSDYFCGNDCYVQKYRAARAATDAVLQGDESAYDDAPEPPLPPVETRRGVSIFVGGGVVRLRRVSDGVERVMTAASARIFDAELEDDGLFYAFNRPRGVFRGRVVFVPFDELFRGAP